MRHKTYGEIKSIGKEDEYHLSQYWLFEVIKDPYEIRDILDEKYSSKNREEPYDKNTPSVTNITDSLYPINWEDSERLIYWLNYKTKEQHLATASKSEKSLARGTSLHKMLELYLKDNHGIGDKSFAEYIYDPVITDEDLMIKTLERFRDAQKGKFKPIAIEKFIKLPYIQGTVDLLCEYDGRLTLCDWKTAADKYSDKIKIKKYYRQLYQYGEMMCEDGVLTKKELENLDYKIFQFNFSTARYKMFVPTKEEIYSEAAGVQEVISWYHNMKG